MTSVWGLPPSKQLDIDTIIIIGRYEYLKTKLLSKIMNIYSAFIDYEYIMNKVLQNRKYDPCSKNIIRTRIKCL